MDSRVEDVDVLISNVIEQLESVAQDSTIPLDEELLKRGERNLDSRTSHQTLWRVMGAGESVLHVVKEEPRPLTRLLEQVVSLIPFDQLKQSISYDKLEQGLNSPSVSIQLLCLAYLRRAADSPSGASFVACSLSLVQTLITTWLNCGKTEVSERCLEVIVALLAVDLPNNVTVMLTSTGVDTADGQGLFWRRLFKDPEIYSIFFKWTSSIKSGYDLSTKSGRQQMTISQARLFEFIVRVAALDWSTITTTTLPDVEHEYITTSDASDLTYGGLLKYAANNMIDEKDYLMDVLRQDFFFKLLAVVEETDGKGANPKVVRAIQDRVGVSL